MDLRFFQSVYNHPGIDAKVYEEISRSHTRHEFPQNTLLLKAGKTAKEFYLIEKGVLRSFLYDFNGKEITTEFYCSEDILIESFSLFQRKPSGENFESLTPTIAWRIDYETFNQLLGKFEQFREWGRSWATAQLYTLKQRSINSLTQTATDRYLALQNERPEIIQHAPLKYIASYLGITDSSLSRIRKDIAGV